MAVVVSFVGKWDGKDVQRGLKQMQDLDRQVNGSSRTFSESFSNMAAKAAVASAAIVGVGAVVGKAISAASDLAESQSKATVVFGDQANAIMEWSKTSATAFGQTQQQALEAAGTYGNLFQAFGLTRKAATEMSTTMVELAADLASFNNTSIDDAIEALRSGLSGETEPLKRFGIALNDARMKQEALRLGIYDGVGALDAAQKAQAAYAVILNDTALAQGDFARTSDGLANQQRILQAQFGDLIAQLGTMLLPVALQVTSALNDMVGALQAAPNWFRQNRETIIVVTIAVAAFAAALYRAQIAMAAVNVVMTAQRILMGTYITAYATATGAVTGLSRAMMAVPWVAAATAIAAVVLELDRGADEADRMRSSFIKTAQATRNWTDETGKLNPALARGAAATRWVHMAQKDYLDAAGAARIYGNAALFAAGATDEQIKTLRGLIGAIGQYVPMALAAADAAAALRATNAESSRYTAQAKALGAEIGWGTRGLQKYNAYLDEVAEKSKKAGGGSKDLKDKVVALDSAMRSTLQSVNRTAVSYDQLTRSLGADDIAAFSRKMLATGEITSKTKDEFEDMVGTIRDRLNTALDAAKQKLGEWQAKYDDTLRTVSDGIRSGNGIADAANAQAEATRALADAQREYDQAVAGSDPDRIAEAGSALAEARKQQGTFLSFLQRGADSAEAFADQIQQLIRANAALEVVQDIAAMGARTGSRIAAELLAGGAAAIDQANRMVAVVGRAALDAGTLAAQTFYGAGLASAQAYVNALEYQVRPMLQALLDDIARQISAALKVQVNANIGGGGPAPAPEPAPAPAPAPFVPILTPQQFRATASGRPPSGEGRIWAEIRAFAEGGIVTQPTFGLIGEAGPEAVIPLDRMSSNGGGTTINLTVNAGMGADGAEVGRQVVEALRQYQRRNGPVPISVA